MCKQTIVVGADGGYLMITGGTTRACRYADGSTVRDDLTGEVMPLGKWVEHAVRMARVDSRQPFRAGARVIQKGVRMAGTVIAAAGRFRWVRTDAGPHGLMKVDQLEPEPPDTRRAGP